METERLQIRKFTPDDWRDLHEYLSQEAVVKYEPYGVFTEEASRNEAIRRSEDERFWAVCLKDGQKLIGNGYLSERNPGVWELGYVFNQHFHGKGYATEAARALVDHAFRHKNAHRVGAGVNPLNVASWKLLERLKFRREGHLLQDTCFKKDDAGRPIWTDSFIYGILASEWRKLVSYA
jgi:RimJ/RimL family protein N-acetyltransferase